MRSNSRVFIFSALGIAINIVLGTVSGMLNIPLLFLDTIGTIFVAVVYGPFYGALTGGLTNVALGIIQNPKYTLCTSKYCSRNCSRFNCKKVEI